MLDKNNLAQLKQLKQKLVDQKEYVVGIVKSTQRRFGFVVADDGREIFLPPEEMQKVFPGDTVRVLLKTDDKGKVSGIVEKVKSSTLTEFTGRYVVKGQGHFVEPDMLRFNRWIFIPSQARKEAKAGDLIRCKISRHAYPHAKPQAKILKIIGAEDQVGIESDYMVDKFQLEHEWPDNWQASITEIDASKREDLTDIPFFTIDAENTKDLDDAVFATSTDDGWQLQVAVADPTAVIIADSELEKAIAKCGTSVYLPGKSLPMLPAELANDRCSLLPSQDRASLVCTMNIRSDGSITDYTMTQAMIRTKNQLSYTEVANVIDGNEASPHCSEHIETITTLNQLSQALRNNRKHNNLVIDGRTDYQFILNDQKKLARIEIKPKNTAHIIIEECMVAANRCAADLLGEHGVFISHTGFRKERLPDAHKLGQEQLGLTDIDAATPEGYRQLMASIDDDNTEFPLRSVLSRLLERSQLSTQRLPHYGMGLAFYTTFTSPIRKYTDFLVHKLIKAKLNGHTPQHPNQEQLDSLQQALGNARQARFHLEQWLKSQFAKGLIGQQLSGHVSQINSNGFTVRLDESLIEGFVETKPLEGKYSFDPMRLRLSNKAQTIELDQPIDVVVKAADSKERSIHFTLPNQCKPNQAKPNQPKPDQPKST
jgi:VacB/RNase II family 3'-5' exoribonuclease